MYYDPEYIDALYKDDMSFANSTFLCSHNAFASIEKGWNSHPMQYDDIEGQYKFGSRAFMIDVHEISGSLVLLHNEGIKIIGGIGSPATKPYFLKEFFKEIYDILRENSSTLLTIIFENKNVSHDKIYKELVSVGLDEFLIKSDPNNFDLNFGQLREANQRLLIFAEEYETSIEGIFSTKYYKETTYSLGSDQSCIDRGEGRVQFDDSKVSVFVLNHFYSQACTSSSFTPFAVIPALINKFPVTHSCQTTNDYNAIMKRVRICQTFGIPQPTLIAVDFINEGLNGGALRAVAELNGANYSFSEQHYEQSTRVPALDFRVYDTNLIFGMLVGFIIGNITGALILYNLLVKKPKKD